MAAKHDLALDLITLGAHRLWRRVALEQSGARQGQNILVVSEGDLSLGEKFARVVGPQGQVVLVNRNTKLTGDDPKKAVKRIRNLEQTHVDLIALPFPDNHFDTISVSFGFTQSNDQQSTLDSLARVLKPGGRLLILDFARIQNPVVGRAYKEFSTRVVPVLGRIMTPDHHEHRQTQKLSQAAAKQPKQEQLQEMMLHSGFCRCEYFNLSGGIVAFHRGFKI